MSTADQSHRQRHCRTRLLSDSPTTEDAFRSHERVAATIADLLTSEDGGRSIALTGSWGSGKSSVVERVRLKLQGLMEVFVLDTWAHQGDPLRRTVLEQLIDFFLDRRWLQNIEDWNRRKSALSRRYQDATTTSTPMLTGWGVALALSGLLVPAGLSLFVKADVKQLWPLPPMAAIGVCLSVLPLLLLLLTYIWWRPWRKSRELFTRRFWTKHAPPYDDQSLAALLLQRTREIRETSTIRTPDPTSVEFQTTFQQLIAEALERSERKLLIVIDNLDRVEPADALSIWATMRTFFDMTGHQRPSWAARLWLLVPFDPTALRRLWAAGSGEAAAVGSDLAKAFVDKSFQISFGVPPPVLSDWQAFLTQQLKTALPEHSEGDFHAVYRIYDLRGVQGQSSPTPRDIKIFVNRIGAIHRHWQDEIPLVQQALYAVLARSDWKPDAELLSDDVLRSIPQELVGADWREALAAIHFGCERDRALQLLMGQKVNQALTAGDAETLHSLQAIPGFAHVCEKIIEEKAVGWREAESRTIAIAAGALAGLRVTEDSSWARSWLLLHQAAGNVSSWSGVDARVGHGISSLLQRHVDEPFARHVIAALGNSLTSEKGEKTSDRKAVEAWTSGVADVLRTVTTNFPIVARDFVVGGSAETYIVVAGIAAEHEQLRDVRAFFSPAADSAEVVRALSESIAQGTYDASTAAGVALMMGLTVEWEWTPLVEPLKARIEGQQASHQEIAPLLSTLFRLKSHNAEASSVLQTLVRQGYVFHYLHATRGANQQKGEVLCVLAILLELPAGGPQQSPGNAPAGATLYQEILQKPEAQPALIQELVDYLAHLDLIDVIFATAETEKATIPLVRAALAEIVARKDGRDQITPARLIAHYDQLTEWLANDQRHALVARLIERSGLLEELIEQTFEANLACLYLDAFQDRHDNQAYASFLIEGLREIARDIWEDELKEEGCLIELVLSMVEAGHKLDLSTSFQDALHAHAGLLLQAKAKVEQLSNRWSSLLNALTESAHTTLVRRILSSMCAAAKPTDQLLAVYGAALSQSDEVERDAEDLVLNGFKNFLQRRGTAELDWIAAVLQAHPTLLKKIDGSTRDDFVERLRNLLGEQGVPEDVKARCLAIAERAGIDISVPEQSEIEGVKPDRD